MTNRGVAWIIVRAFGVYFAAQALLGVFVIVSYSLNLAALIQITEIRSLTDEAQSQIYRAWTNIGIQSVELIFFMALTYYCLRQGTFLHRLLMLGSEKDDAT